MHIRSYKNHSDRNRGKAPPVHAFRKLKLKFFCTDNRHQVISTPFFVLITDEAFDVVERSGGWVFDQTPSGQPCMELVREV